MDVTVTPCEGVVPRCAICHDDVLDDALRCAGCRTLVHPECREGQCPTLGCTPGVRRGARVTTVPRPAGRPLPFLERQIIPGLGGWLVLGVLVALLLAHVTVGVMGQGHVARVERVRADMHALAKALELFRLDCRDHPRQLSSLWERPAELPTWSGPYLTEPPRDPWGSPYVYVRRAGNTYEVISLGADGAPGGADQAADLSSLTINDG